MAIAGQRVLGCIHDFLVYIMENCVGCRWVVHDGVSFHGSRSWFRDVHLLQFVDHSLWCHLAVPDRRCPAESECGDQSSALPGQSVGIPGDRVHVLVCLDAADSCLGKGKKKAAIVATIALADLT